VLRISIESADSKKYSYGAPAIANPALAAVINQQTKLGSGNFRVTHVFDGTPNSIPGATQYSPEYYITAVGAAQVKIPDVTVVPTPAFLQGDLAVVTFPLAHENYFHLINCGTVSG
jgi:hypothetical protein